MKRCRQAGSRVQSAGLGGPGLGSFCRERGLSLTQDARLRQAAKDANGPNAPSMADQRDLKRRNQGQARMMLRTKYVHT